MNVYESKSSCARANGEIDRARGRFGTRGSKMRARSMYFALQISSVYAQTELWSRPSKKYTAHEIMPWLSYAHPNGVSTKSLWWRSITANAA